MSESREDTELIPTERVAIMTYMLARGHRFTTLEASVIAGLSRTGAWRMLSKISRVLPLCGPDVESGRRWYMLPDEDA